MYMYGMQHAHLASAELKQSHASVMWYLCEQAYLLHSRWTDRKAPYDWTKRRSAGCWAVLCKLASLKTLRMHAHTNVLASKRGVHMHAYCMYTRLLNIFLKALRARRVWYLPLLMYCANCAAHSRNRHIHDRQDVSYLSNKIDTFVEAWATKPGPPLHTQIRKYS